jgi:hypothetical protein
MMSGYTASARIASARPHLRTLDPDANRPVTVWSLPFDASGGHSDTKSPPTIGPAIDPIDDDPSWLERMSIGWGQLTWYLFNPEGWR